MGLGGISIWQLLIILVIIVLLFGTKRLRNIGQDLGSAIRGFRSSIKDPEENNNAQDATFPAEQKANPAVTAQQAPTTPTATPAQPAAAPTQNNSSAQVQDKH